MAVYLLETNAARALGRRVLETAAAQGRELLLSPITFWELACRLGDEPFRLRLGNIRKGLLFCVLDDPLAEMMADVGCAAAVNPTRFEDREAVTAVLAEIDQIRTYSELMERTVLVRGETRRIGDIARRAEDVFNAERERFVSSIRAQAGRYVEKYGRTGTIHMSGTVFAQEAAQLAKGLREDAMAAGCTVTFAAVAERTLLGAGYAVARTCASVASVGEGQTLLIDGNDLEDYLISLHLGISSGRILVTDDTGLRTAINRTLDALCEHFTANGGALATSTALMTTGEFRALVEAESTGSPSDG